MPVILTGVFERKPHATGGSETLVLLAPYNGLLVEAEAILFLWFPRRVVSGSAMDFTILGRQMLVMFAKLMVAGFAGGAAARIDVSSHAFPTPSSALALLVAWLSLAGFVAALIPLAVTGFDQLDVARDPPR
jgi:hypothetical protein